MTVPEPNISTAGEVPSPNNPLRSVLGGRRGALESALPSVVFVSSYVASGRNLTLALAFAIGSAAVLAVLRLLRRERPVRVLGGLVLVALEATVAARLGSAAGYFLPLLLANCASILIWVFSIVAGWPMLGVILGFALGQKTRWRQDPDLLRAYSRASWIWAASYAIRVAVNAPLYLNEQVVGLGVSRVVLGWPLVVAVVALSWIVIRRTLPPDHPGILHPRTAQSAA